MRLKVFFLDNELKSRATLRNMIQQDCENVEVIGESQTVEDAAQQINKLKPDVVFLDIELSGQKGFELFDYFPFPSFSVIFASADSRYALKAFRMAAIDYLLKPFNIKQLQEALRRVWQKKQFRYQEKKLRHLKEYEHNKTRKLALPIQNGLNFIEIESILRCEANRNYTYCYLTNGEKLIVSKPLCQFEEMLEGTHFFRLNRSHLVNLNYLKSYEKSRLGIVTLVNGDTVVISRTRREAFLERIQGL